jgi:hypothetical protein
VLKGQERGCSLFKGGKEAKEKRMKRIQTERGMKWVQSFPMDEKLWGIYQDKSKPRYMSVRKNHKGEWWASIWGETEEEVKAHLKDLGRRQAKAASPSYGRQVACKCERPVDEGDGECMLCGLMIHYTGGEDG